MGQGNISHNETLTLDKGDSSDNGNLFDELPIGSYHISLTFKPEEGTEFPDVLLPNYTIQITAFDGMTAEEDGFDGTQVSLRVSGSSTYEVAANNRTYTYEFNDSSENTIKVPLLEGSNKLMIKGDSDCKGIIEKNIILNVVALYPNPSRSLVHLNSNLFKGKIQIHLFDMHGKLVYSREESNSASSIVLDISYLKTGLYLGQISIESENIFDFKLIKN